MARVIEGLVLVAMAMGLGCLGAAEGCWVKCRKDDILVTSAYRRHPLNPLFRALDVYNNCPNAAKNLVLNCCQMAQHRVDPSVLLVGHPGDGLCVYSHGSVLDPYSAYSHIHFGSSDHTCNQFTSMTNLGHLKWYQSNLPTLWKNIFNYSSGEVNSNNCVRRVPRHSNSNPAFRRRVGSTISARGTTKRWICPSILWHYIHNIFCDTM